jgi:hypothetical protein
LQGGEWNSHVEGNRKSGLCQRGRERGRENLPGEILQFQVESLLEESLTRSPSFQTCLSLPHFQRSIRCSLLEGPLTDYPLSWCGTTSCTIHCPMKSHGGVTKVPKQIGVYWARIQVFWFSSPCPDGAAEGSHQVSRQEISVFQSEFQGTPRFCCQMCL